jgi:hypothetical protein
MIMATLSSLSIPVDLGSAPAVDLPPSIMPSALPVLPPDTWRPPD